MSFARENHSWHSEIDLSYVYAQGAFKNVYKGKYTNGPRKKQACVCKLFKSGSVFKDAYFANELKVVDKALEVVNRFNKVRFINKSIWLNQPAIWTFEKGSSRAGEKNLIEPMIENFEKFNSNTGWTPDYSTAWSDVMQALSHYSYHTTNRAALLCDLQGGIYRDGFIITDPVIMSRNREYGPTDLGPEGISTFFSRHQCNQYCRSNWLTPHDQSCYFKVQKGSSMVLPTRVSRTPLSRNNGVNQLAMRMGGLEIIEE